MLAGEAVVAIWNGIAPEMRDSFYDWHVNEHMPERVGIPGFRRGRRYVAADEATHPEFFTLYEVEAMPVLQGQDYANRLNDPTPGTRANTSQFQDTFRALSRVLVSHGPGMGGALLTVRFDCDAQHLPAVRALVRAAAEARRVTGAHLCQGDAAASAVRTAETRGRSDVQTPPSCFVLVEATDPAALEHILLDRGLAGAGAEGPFVRGIYRLEYVRMKTGFAG
ncbi:MAG: hypothetical protein BGO51_27815 [Rhodospirillales bacterium 69-11]|nr:hypothetical protein [Rhodospirillales bacterium]OJW25134.1 MAG: hypothetical protein BGO51_27815 [Rhodospirillales bacterium 69-11]